MPISCDPQQTAEVQISKDAEAPAESRATFRYRYLTCRQMAQREDLLTRASKAAGVGDEAATDKLLNEALAVGLVGWDLRDPDGKPVPYEGNVSAIDAGLTAWEKWMLAYEVPGQVRLSEKKRWSLPSPSNTDGANSAPTAGTPASA